MTAVMVIETFSLNPSNAITVIRALELLPLHVTYISFTYIIPKSIYTIGAIE